jgi:hypothetical protein
VLGRENAEKAARQKDRLQNSLSQFIFSVNIVIEPGDFTPTECKSYLVLESAYNNISD